MVNLSAASRRSSNNVSNHNQVTKLTTVEFPHISGKKVNFSNTIVNFTKNKTSCERSDSGFSETNDEKPQTELKNGDIRTTQKSKNEKEIKNVPIQQSNDTDSSNSNVYIPRKLTIIPNSKTALLRKKFEDKKS